MKRVWTIVLGLLALLFVITVAGLGAAAWMAYTAEGTQRLVALMSPWLSQLTVLEPKGALLGDFQARQVIWQDSKQHRITIDEPSWRGFTVRHQSVWRWQLAVHADAMHAKRVKVDWPSQPDQPATPFPLNWHLPLSVTVDDVAIAQIESPQIGAAPLMHLKASLALQQGSGLKSAAHAIDLKNLQWEQWQLQGQFKAQLQAMPVMDLRVLATSPQGRADLTIKGLLERMALAGQVEVAPLDKTKNSESGVRQTLQVSAQVTPLASWPLASLTLDANVLDLQQISAQLPQTALTGQAELQPQKAPTDDSASVKPSMHLHIDMNNAAAGVWTKQRVPVQSLQADVTWPLATVGKINLQGFWRAGRVQAAMRLSPNRAPVKVTGHWDLDQLAQTDLTATLDGVLLKGLHEQAPALRVSGDVQVQGQKDQRWAINAQLKGNDTGDGQWPSGVQVQGQALWSPKSVQVSTLRLTAGQAKAEFKGDWAMASGEQWQSSGSMDVRQFNPLLWLPALAPSKGVAGPTVISGQGQWKLAGVGTAWPQGQANITLTDSQWLGVATSGQAQWQAAQQWQLKANLQAAGNAVDVQVSMPKPSALPKDFGVSVLLASPGVDAKLNVQGSALAGLQAWATPWQVTGLAGDVNAQMQWSSAGRGQWRTTGQASSAQLKLKLQEQDMAATKMQTNWTLGFAQGLAAQSSPLQLDMAVEQGRYGTWQVQQWQARLTGTAAQHDWQSQGRLDLPPRTSSSGRQVTQSLRMQFAGAGQLSNQAGQSHWHGEVNTLRADTLALTSTAAWLDVQPFTVDIQMQPQAMAWAVSPTRLAWMGLPLKVDVAQGDLSASRRVDVQASLEPTRAAEWLSLWQPQAGWGGDLLIQGQVKVRHSLGQPWFVQAKVARQSGDLTQTNVGIEGASSLALGLRAVELTLDADKGVWRASQSLDGQLLGQVSGQQTIRLNDPLSLPSATDALSGALQAKIQDVQTLGVWAPAGWRLAGHLQAQAKVTGTLGQPLFSGEINGQDLGAANTLQGIELKRGYLQLQLAGTQARLTALTFQGAGKDPGELKISGEASLGAAPEAKLNITATRFHVLNRDDRQARVSGQANLVFNGLDKAMLEGNLSFDQGLFDVSQADAPSIGDDVNVINLPGDAGVALDSTGASAQTRRQWQVNLNLNLGDQLRLKGRGLNTRLTGALRLSTPNGRPQLKGTVKTVDGTFASYGQKLVIERGTLSFSGPLDNPRLDIKAMRVQSPLAESSDVKVGVVIGGTALDPRVSLYSEPPMSETEKLSWLVLGRGPTGLGSADIGLLQTAASALFSGEGGTPQDSLVGALGLDELSVRQTDGAVRDTIVTVGKQLSSRWYLGYERSLTATAGTWQALYRATQRMSVRLQTGDDDAIDLIWQWRQRVPPNDAAK